MRRLFVLFLVLFIVFTAWVGIDRARLQRRILELEYQADGIMLARDMAAYRKAHPFRGGSP